MSRTSVDFCAALLPLAAIVLFAGCGERTVEKEPNASVAVAFGKLPGLKAAPDKWLQDELARIVEEGGTPEILAEPRLAGEDNAATAVRSLFPAAEIQSIYLKSEELFPAGPFSFGPIALERAIQFRREYDEQRLAAREALLLPGCEMGIRHNQGYSAELSLVNVFWICARLEAFWAAERLADDDRAAAIEAVEKMLRLARGMAAEKNATVRLQAAFLRTETLSVIQSIAGRKSITREDLGRIHAAIREQLADWPPDADAWIGDRALGMYAYELARAGQLRSMLTPEEIARFTEEEILSQFPAAAERAINDDEAYYLKAMRKIIESCQQPYHARREVFEEIRTDLHERRNSPDFPLIAGRLLLPDIEKGHVIQARDRANCEAWALATALATGVEPDSAAVNPLTGKPFRVDRDGPITVSGVGQGTDGDDPPVVVPDLGR